MSTMEVTSNWPSDCDSNLQDIIRESEKLPSGELEDLLDEEKCISLARAEGEEEDGGCVIRLAARSTSLRHTNGFSPRSKRLLVGFMVLSEARVIEVCTGTHEEYFKTVHGSLLGDFGDSKIFKCEFQFEKCQETVVLKLKGTCHGESVWIYGFHITTAVDPECANAVSRSRFGSEHLSSVLKEKDVQMSKEAMKFRQMLESYNNGMKEKGDALQGADPMNLMSIMFGSMIPSARPEMFPSSLGEGNARKKKGRVEDEIESVISKVESETKRVKGTTDGSRESNLYKVENALKHLALYPENKLLKEKSTRMADGGSESPMQVNRLVEKLQNYMDDGSAAPKSMMELTNMLQKSVGVDPGPNSFNVTERNAIGFKSKNSLMENCQESSRSESTEGLCKCSKSSQDVMRGNVTQSQGSAADASIQQDSNRHVISADFEDRLAQQVERLIDEKLAAMEDRLMKKFEQKLVEKIDEESVKLNKIENLLERIYERL
ncbi:LOW QUALITY PROTEIN: uncharacterized protein LOC119588075 [Penaeus monodon]|uniref:LOW QUALITY PROTEIN: uncharacterized protein LOC119588075 n=1 Tax=Penaeus monodon TaxID=6687 RepID=UPI0018A7B929|nr:LOW QUALITY PROTEIN: uncharacterized protein LOC119588075 [Penaeus monodon]